MSTYPEYGRDWMWNNWQTSRILHGIPSPEFQNVFMNAVETKSLEYSTQQGVLDYYATVDPETIQGYQKLTVDTLGDPRVHHRGTNEQRRRDDGGFRAGASEAAGTPRYTGYPEPPFGSSGSLYNNSRSDPRDTYGTMRSDFQTPNDVQDLTDPYGRNPILPRPTALATNFTSQRGNAYGGSGQANRGSRGNPQGYSEQAGRSSKRLRR